MASLSFREKAGYSTGEFGGSGLWQIMMIFLPAFYTDVYGLPAAAVGTMLLVVRFIDAGTDPVMGIIADRTRSPHGHFRPYLLWSAVPFGMGAFALFAGPELETAGKLAYAYSTYIMMMVVYTAAMIPYSALSGVMTADYQERTSLNTFRFVGAFAAALVVQALVQRCVRWFGDGDAAAGYRWTMAIFGGLAMVMFWISFRSTAERIRPASETGGSVRRDLADLMRNQPWIIILSVALVSLIYISIRSAAQIYYFKYAVLNEDLVSSFMVFGTAATIIAILLTGQMTRLLDKRSLYLVCMVVSALGSLGFYFVHPTNVPLLFILQIVGSFASGPTMPLLWSMMADAADYSEWRNRRRATGLVFSASTFATKLGGAVGGAVAMYVLALTGYQANVEQTEEVVAGLRQMMGLYPAAGALICTILLSFYRLDRERMTQIANELQARRALKES